MNIKLRTLPLLILFVVIGVVSTPGQGGQPPGPQAPTNGNDPIRQLNLTPEQREQIRLLREQNRDERARITQRVRETNRALDEVLNSENVEEAVIEHRMREASAAQAAAMRIRILSEVKIRRVLTPEQRTLLRSLRRDASERREGRRLDNIEERQKRGEERSLRLRERRKNMPLLPGARRRRPIL